MAPGNHVTDLGLAYAPTLHRVLRSDQRIVIVATQGGRADREFGRRADNA